MTEQEFDAWAYQRARDYLTETPFAAEEKRGADRVKAFMAGIESDRKVFVTD